MRSNRTSMMAILSAVVLAGMAGCSGKKTTIPAAGETADASRPIGNPITVKPPLGLPAVPVPHDNPVTADAVVLGRKLFFDRRLSSDNSLSCSSCHNPLLGFTDGQRHSTGVAKKIGTRNAPSVVNAAFNSFQFWDGRAPTLEDQAGGPMENTVEMNQPHEVAVSKLKADAAYRAQFGAVFGPGPITIGKIEKALASYERMLISGNSAFDRYQFGGDKTALTPAAIRGLEVFQDPKRGNCATCHTIQKGYAIFTDGKFHNIGVGVDDEGNLTDLGRYNTTKADSDRGAFKTPSLRNVALTAPYMHDGSLKTLKDVVDFYAGRGNSNPHLDPNIKAITLSGRDRADLIEFLKSLSGETPADPGAARTAALN